MKRRRGPAEDPPELRPVGARALKSARDTLRPYLGGARVLDLFAGQGRFAFAALEEGAEEAVLVEKNARTARELSAAAKRVSPAARVVCDDAFHFLSTDAAAPYDVVFADPPFPLWTPDFARRLAEAVKARLAEGAIFLVKVPARVLASESISGLQLWKNSPFGESRLLYYTHGAGDSKR